MRRAAEPDEGKFPQSSTWGRAARAVQQGLPSAELVVGVTCDECRVQMWADDLLNNLRCAECRQIKFEQFYDVGLRVALLAFGGVCVWLLLRRAR